MPPYQQYSQSTTPLPDGLSAVNVNITYPVAVLNHTVFVTRLIPELLKSGKGVEKYEIVAASSAVRGLHSLIRGGIHPKFKQNYLEKSGEILKNISDKELLNSKEERYKLIDFNYDLLDLICDNFGAAGILAAIEETTDLSTTETGIRKDNERILRVAIFLLRKHGDKLFEMIKAGQPPKILSNKKKLSTQLKEKSFKEVFSNESGNIQPLI